MVILKLNNMIIQIHCDQTDCIYCKGGHTGNCYSWENRCYHPHPRITKHGVGYTCLSKVKHTVQHTEFDDIPEDNDFIDFYV